MLCGKRKRKGRGGKGDESGLLRRRTETRKRDLKQMKREGNVEGEKYGPVEQYRTALH